MISAAQPPVAKDRVVYLLGAGATHGGLKFYGSSFDILMPNLSDELLESTSKLLQEDEYKDNPNLLTLMNSVVNTDTDFEQFFTFLEESVSATYRDFAGGMKGIFSKVLRSRLEDARTEITPRHSQLYATLIDMYDVKDFGELLKGFLTLNYDNFLESAIVDHLTRSVDFGVAVGSPEASDDSVRVLKLHGSFSWSEHWPIEVSEEEQSLWIAPGIHKRKTDYPFNAHMGSRQRNAGLRCPARNWLQSGGKRLGFAFSAFHYEASECEFGCL